MTHEPGGETFTPPVRRRHHPAEPHHAVGLGEDAEIGNGQAGIIDPEVHGGGLDIAPVELRVRAGLLHHEHRDAQLEQPVQGEDIELGEGGGVDRRH